MDKIRIVVTERDIEAGLYARQGEEVPSLSCPVFQALHRRKAGLGFSAVSVGSTRIMVWYRPRGRAKVYELPPKARAFIEAFDSFEGVEPIRFTALGVA